MGLAYAVQSPEEEAKRRGGGRRREEGIKGWVEKVGDRRKGGTKVKGGGGRWRWRRGGLENQ